MTDEKVSVEVGEKVRVFDNDKRWSQQPDDGWPAQVVKVARVLVHIQRDRDRVPTVYRLDTQTENGEFSRSYFRTLEQQAAHERAEAARAVLAEWKVKFDWQSRRLTADELEAVVEALRPFMEAS